METRGGFLISQIKQIQGRIFSRLLVEAKIEEFNGAQGRILYVLWQEDNLPIVELAKRTGLAKTTLTGMLDRMESQGHVVRCCDTKDRRQIRIRLTEQAQRLEEKYGQVSDEMSRLFYKGFADEEIKALENGLERILRNLEAEEGQAYKSSE
ncbi:MAG: MarR family transcriptional regulator [Acetatifactor sp.]|nr:MarR family transcriptional regulator [Acetatifactor sp.]